MKKILSISAIFVGIGLIICLIVGFCLPIDVSVAKGSAVVFKLLTGFEFFIKYLPPLIFTGFTISCAVQYGRNPEGSAERYSPAMFKRYKFVMITALIITAVITFATEVGGLYIRYNKNKIINQPKLINEYVKVGNNLFENGYYERAMVYADAALKLNPDSRAAQNLKDKSDVEINRQNNINYRFRLYEAANEDLNSVTQVKIDADQILAVYNCYTKAKECYENKEWFNAHYYAELGKSLATPKDPNLKQLQIISTSAWNNLTQQTKLAKNQDQINFDRKYEGYKALVEKDDLKAYYIFKELFETSPDLQRDPDVKFYLEIAENRVHEKYFFIDETFELASFESANDVYYAYPYKDGSKDIIYFKGVSTVQATGNSIQYLRNLTIESIDANGELFRTMTVPYAKVLPVDCKSINSTTKMLMGIDDKADFVPYIMLNSVGRDKPNTEIRAKFIYADGSTETNTDYLLLPLPYSDFLMLETVGQNPDLMPIPNLFKMVKRASEFGFSPEIFCQSLLSRLMFPVVIILIILYLAAFGWINRININDYFKMSWAFAFPFMFVIGVLFYRVILFCFKLINFAVLGFVNGIVPAIFVCLGINIFCFVGLSLYFCGRRSRM